MPSSDLQAHALLLPFPESGHINPLMELAKHLASQGILITFVNTQYNHKRMLQSNTARLPSNMGLPIRLVHIPDGLSEHDNRDNDLMLLTKTIQNVGPALEDLIDRLAPEGPPITCIISDILAFQTVDVAKKLGIPRVCFWLPNACIHAFVCHALHGASNGTFPTNGIPEPDEVTSFPGLPACPTYKLPWLLGSKEDAEVLFQSLRPCLDALQQSEWALCNSVPELEINELPPGFSPLCLVGPILPTHILEKEPKPDSRMTTSLWAEEHTCLDWLDTQKPHSVLYVSLGSVATLNKEQLFELAYGLESTDLPVLWVVRHNIMGVKGCVFPEGFLERTEERIRVVAWAPQLMVLSHDAIGGFLTHNGWNSTIEAMSMGVPMLVWPQFTDQFMTADLVVGQ
eukprot:c29210_g1_i1 orf=168-1364(+)